MELLGGAPYRVPKHCTVRGADGRPVRVEYGENDHCCARFALADGWLRARGLPSVPLRELYRNPTIRDLVAVLHHVDMGS